MRLVAALAAMVVLFGIAQAGSSYFYCPAMHMVMEAPCCGQSSERDEAPVAEVHSSGCCERHTVGALPSSAGANAAPFVFAPALIAVLAVATAQSLTPSADARRIFDHEGRAGPIALARQRAELMIALN